MNKITKRIVSITAGLGLSVGLLAGVAPQAHAGTCTKVGPITLCGKVTLLKGSSRSLAVGNGWNGTCTGKKYIRPGETSTRFFKDTDCWEVPDNHHAHVGTLTYKENSDIKIRDGQHIRVTVHRGTKH